MFEYCLGVALDVVAQSNSRTRDLVQQVRQHFTELVRIGLQHDRPIPVDAQTQTAGDRQGSHQGRTLFGQVGDINVARPQGIGPRIEPREREQTLDELTHLLARGMAIR